MVVPGQRPIVSYVGGLELLVTVKGVQRKALYR